MKTATLNQFLLFLLLLPATTFANTLIIKGTVQNANKQPLAGKTVKIVIDSTLGTACNMVHTVVTNPNGYYIDTIQCTGSDINKVKVMTEDCNGNWLVNTAARNSGSSYIESNFIVCVPPTTASCKALFSFQVSGLAIGVKSDSSLAPAGDSIVQRIWKWGDNSLTDGNNKAATHSYAKAGRYEVCLYIKTAKGCESRLCAVIELVVPATSCKAIFSSEYLGQRTYRFNSTGSLPATGDSIVQRIWKINDSVVLNGREINPAISFRDTGKYNVCLKIVTGSGCYATYCSTITIKDSLPPAPVTCKAYFSYGNTPGTSAYTVGFNSLQSQASSNTDSIIARTWSFGDNTDILTGNRKDPSHNYTKAGTYNVCLNIKTAKGCESKYCTTVTIKDTVTTVPACKAYFAYNHAEGTSAYTIKFNGQYAQAGTGDSIIARTWSFGDSSNLLTGNRMDPAYTYRKAGVYNVCLSIKTLKGCESKYCTTITIKDTVATVPACKAYFTYIQSSSLSGYAFSFNSLVAQAAAGDSIIARTWLFGDSSAAITGNRKDPVHTYSKPGTYNVCLSIQTQKGCESRYCATIVIKAPETHCQAQFSDERLGWNKIRFNSNNSQTVNGDSIVSRTWKFGDGTVLTGNTINPLKEFPMKGIYTVCLQIKTASGCSSDICKIFEIRDTASNTPAPQSALRIININPNPVVSRMLATIWTKTGIEVEISIYDIYGVRKWGSKKALVQGNNIVEVPVLNLQKGPYFLQVTSALGKDSRIFYKL